MIRRRTALARGFDRRVIAFHDVGDLERRARGDPSGAWSVEHGRAAPRLPQEGPEGLSTARRPGLVVREEGPEGPRGSNTRDALVDGGFRSSRCRRRRTRSRGSFFGGGLGGDPIAAGRHARVVRDWRALNLAGVVFFGVAHQGGVAPALLALPTLAASNAGAAGSNSA